MEQTIQRLHDIRARPTGGDRTLVELCARESLKLLESNLTPGGILAATPGPDAEARRYTRVFGRDAAICALGMAGSGIPALERGAVASLDSLAALQAPNGQIPKYVDAEANEADFWYLGCIDATLWWLLAVDHVRRRSDEPVAESRWQTEVRRALDWLLAQEHQRFFLLQQNEASDWADIMPRSGFVLYSNALWYRVKQVYDLPRVEETHYHFNHLFHPFSRDLPEYRRARLLGHYARRGARNRDLYLSFVNLSTFGDEGDVFGNLLTILFGLAGDSMAQRIVRVLEQRAAEPLPVRAVLDPLTPEDRLWRQYMERHRQNLAHQYHNGGIWPFIGSLWVMALASLGKRRQARVALADLAWANSLADWRFSEWFHGTTYEPMGMPGQSWNAATFLMAREAVEEGTHPLMLTNARTAGRSAGGGY
ncbi:MAG TPA: glycoside hydrolase 100 family protein [Pseudomonadales bacterium]